jgi:hypothetical protein
VYAIIVNEYGVCEGLDNWQGRIRFVIVTELNRHHRGFPCPRSCRASCNTMSHRYSNATCSGVSLFWQHYGRGPQEWVLRSANEAVNSPRTAPAVTKDDDAYLIDLAESFDVSSFADGGAKFLLAFGICDTYFYTVAGCSDMYSARTG